MYQQYGPQYARVWLPYDANVWAMGANKLKCDQLILDELRVLDQLPHIVDGVMCHSVSVPTPTYNSFGTLNMSIYLHI
jgi:hypothetical protein